MAKTRKTRSDAATGVQPQRLRKLLCHLVDIYSPSGKEEAILEYLHAYLKKRHLPVIRQPVDDSRYNLLVLPAENEIDAILVGHLDTVVAYDLDDYAFREDGDTVFGLGTSDMKGGCAAMIEAYVSAWEKASSSLRVGLVLVVGEEEEGDGAWTLVEDYHFPWAIIGEPTELRPCLSHYGYVEIQIIVRGKRMHASLAKREQNPVEAMLKLLLALTTHIGEKRPEIVYNIRDLYSPPAGFVVPEWCEVWVDTHLPPEAPIGEITVELEEIIAKQKGNYPHLDIVIRYTAINAGYTIPEKGAFVGELKKIFKHQSLPWKPQPFRSHSDASSLWEAGIKPIILGPGQLDQAHAPGESVSFEQVSRAAEMYHKLILSVSSSR